MLCRGWFSPYSARDMTMSIVKYVCWQLEFLAYVSCDLYTVCSGSHLKNRTLIHTTVATYERDSADKQTAREMENCGALEPFLGFPVMMISTYWLQLYIGSNLREREKHTYGYHRSVSLAPNWFVGVGDPNRITHR